MTWLWFNEISLSIYFVPDWIIDCNVAIPCCKKYSVCRNDQKIPKRESCEPHTTDELVIDAVTWHMNAVDLDSSRQQREAWSTHVHDALVHDQRVYHLNENNNPNRLIQYDSNLYILIAMRSLSVHCFEHCWLGDWKGIRPASAMSLLMHWENFGGPGLTWGDLTSRTNLEVLVIITSNAACSGANTICPSPLQVVTWTATSYPELSAWDHRAWLMRVVDSIRIPSLKIIGFPVPQIWLIDFHSGR